MLQAGIIWKLHQNEDKVQMDVPCDKVTEIYGSAEMKWLHITLARERMADV